LRHPVADVAYLHERDLRAREQVADGGLGLLATAYQHAGGDPARADAGENGHRDPGPVSFR
jgi:hypothetical protein